MKSCRRCDFTHYLFSFPPWETLNLDDLNNSIKACHHTHRLSWILSVYPKNAWINSCMWWFSHVWLLTVLPGSPRAPSFPWEQTCSLVPSSLLGNSLHQIMKHSTTKSRSYWPAASHIIALNYISLTFSPGGPLGPGKPCYKRKHHFVRLVMQMMQQVWNGKAHRCH